MKDGFFRMTDNDYFEIDALSNSFLKHFDRSPAHAFTDIEETASMKFGKFGHAFLLSPFEFKKLILAPPECEKKSLKPYKDFQKLHPGNEDKIILLHEFESFKRIKENLLDHNMEIGKFGDFYSKCEKELSMFYFDPEFNRLLKGKLDLFYDVKSDLVIVFDPKFTTDSSQLKSQIIDKKLKYYRQAAFYSYLIKQLTGKNCLFYFIGLEKKEPYGINSYRPDDDLLKVGLAESKNSIEKYNKWVEDGSIIKSSWDGTEIVQCPKWLKYLIN